jgi:hypothetical protein
MRERYDINWPCLGRISWPRSKELCGHESKHRHTEKAIWVLHR